MDVKIPKQIQVGGQTLNIHLVERYNDLLGECSIPEGYIKLAKTYKGNLQSHSSLENTFIHECIHAILDTMSKTELSEDEVFVSTFAGFTLEIIKSIKEFYDYDS